MRDVLFNTRIGAIEGAYCGMSGFVSRRNASLPDLCAVCGAPANGPTYRAKFEPYHHLDEIFLLYEIAYLIFGKSYLVDLPSCSICTPENFEDIRVTQIDENFGVFAGAARKFSQSLPLIPVALAAEIDGNWRRRATRFFIK